MERLSYLLTIIFTILALMLFNTISRAQTSFNVSNKTSGDTLLTIDNDGKVGIGTTAPVAKGLEVLSSDPDQNGSIRVGTSDLSVYLRLYSGRASSPNPFIMWNEGSALRFGTSFGSEFARLTSEGNLGIGTTAPTEMLEVADTIYSSVGGFKFPDGSVQSTSAFGGDNGFLSTGTFGIGSIPVEGAGTRMMWYPAKAAFRVGQVLGTNWNDTQVGDNSIALGYNNLASGLNSVAFGGNNIASATVATALGGANVASGIASTALGNDTEASGAYSTAMGLSTIASGTYSTAIGYGIESSGSHSMAIALSDQTGINVSQDNTFAIMGGKVGVGEFAPNAEFQVGGLDGVLFTGTFGSGTIPEEGEGTRMMWHPAKAAFRVGRLYSSGINFWDNDSIGDYSFAAGENTRASEPFSVAFGYNTNSAGNSSLAAGFASRAINSYSTATGYYTIASGRYSAAMGFYTEASNDAAFSVGTSTIASGASSTAMGSQTNASASYSTALGLSTQASDWVSTAMGGYTNASGYYTTAMGYNTNAQSYASVALGRYNDDQGNSGAWVLNDLVLSIGDGTSTTPSNLLEVEKNGDMWIQGTLTQNSDKNLKSNIKPVNDALQNIQKIKGVTFQWDNTEQMGDRTEFGVIAQDVEKVFPELVGENEGYKTTNYIGLIPVLIEALKDQQKIIEQQNKNLEELQNRIVKLENEN